MADANPRRLHPAMHARVEELAAAFIKRHGALDPALYALNLSPGQNGGLSVKVACIALPQGANPRPREPCQCLGCACLHHVHDGEGERSICIWCKAGYHALTSDDRPIRQALALSEWFAQFQREALGLPEGPEKDRLLSIIKDAREAMRGGVPA